MLGQAKFGSKNFKDCLKFFDMLEIWCWGLLGVDDSLSRCSIRRVRFPSAPHMVFLGRAQLFVISNSLESWKDRHIYSRRLLGEELGCHPCKNRGFEYLRECNLNRMQVGYWWILARMPATDSSRISRCSVQKTVRRLNAAVYKWLK